MPSRRAREQTDDREKKEDRAVRRKHLFLGFLRLKGPMGVVQREEKTEGNVSERAGQQEKACCFFLKRDMSLEGGKEGNSGRKRGRKSETPV